MPRASVAPLARALVGLCAAALVVYPTPALGQAAPPPGASAVSQYAEQIPGAGGPTAPGVGETTRVPLPEAGRDALDRAPAETARLLEEIATSSDYGAPVAGAPDPDATDGGTGTAGSSLDDSFRSTVTTIASASDARLFGLFVMILGTTLAAAAVAVRRGRA
jgi:hypothetical protein